MMNGTINRLMAAGVVVLAMTGCARDEAAAEGEGAFFAPEGESRSVELILERQRARGAAADGTLHAVHFDGDALNALGRQKLDAIATDSGGGAVRVYLDVAGESGPREAAVRSHLEAAGVALERVAIERGGNAATRHLASVDAGRLYRTEGGRVSAAEANEPGVSPEPAEPMMRAAGR